MTEAEETQLSISALSKQVHLGRFLPKRDSAFQPIYSKALSRQSWFGVVTCLVTSIHWEGDRAYSLPSWRKLTCWQLSGMLTLYRTWNVLQVVEHVRTFTSSQKSKKKALYCHIQVTYTPSSLFPPTNCDPAYILSSIWGQEHEGVAGLWKQNAEPSLTAPKPMTLVPGKTRGKSAELSPFGMHISYVSQQDGVHLPSINRLQFVPWFQVGLWRADPAAHPSIWLSAHVLSFSLGHRTYDFCWSPLLQVLLLLPSPASYWRLPPVFSGPRGASGVRWPSQNFRGRGIWFTFSPGDGTLPCCQEGS